MSEPELPVKLGACSNGEYAPVQPSATVREAQRRAITACHETADRIGMERRRFLHSSMASAVTLLALNACSSESGGGAGGSFDLGSSSTTSPATTEPDAAAEAFRPPGVVVDVQNHFLDYDLAVPGSERFGAGFPQARCGEADARACFSAEQWRSLVFEQSDTSVAVLSAIPVVSDPDPLSIEVMVDAQRVVDELCTDARVLVQGHAVPNVGRFDDVRELMLATADEHSLSAWKVYTHAGRGFRLDDADPEGLPVGQAFIDIARESGVPTVAVHKGFSGGSRWASPADIGPAAGANPDVRFLVYHSGYEAGGREGPYDAEGGGVDRLIRSLADAGVGAGGNVYAELGSTWRSVMADPDQAAHLLGKLLLAVGEDRVLWGTDSIWYGSPQDQLQAFRTFRISQQFQEQFGYPELTDAVKAKILGGNAVALLGIDVADVPCSQTTEVEQARIEFGTNRLFGPRTSSAARRLFAREHPWF